jgi:hypothetical protein
MVQTILGDHHAAHTSPPDPVDRPAGLRRRSVRANRPNRTNLAGRTCRDHRAPQTERIEPGSDEPATRIEPRRGTQIKEKRNNGQVTEVEVQAAKAAIPMKPNQPAGNAQPGDAQSSAFRAPQWQVMEFDLNGKKKAARMPRRSLPKLLLPRRERRRQAA